MSITCLYCQSYLVGQGCYSLLRMRLTKIDAKVVHPKHLCIIIDAHTLQNPQKIRLDKFLRFQTYIIMILSTLILLPIKPKNIHGNNHVWLNQVCQKCENVNLLSYFLPGLTQDCLELLSQFRYGSTPSRSAHVYIAIQ